MSKQEALEYWPLEGLEPFNEGDTVTWREPETQEEAAARFVIHAINWDFIWFTDGSCCRTERVVESFAKVI